MPRTYLDLSTTKAGQRCLNYIEAVSKETGNVYDLGATERNEVTLHRLFEACVGYDTNDPMYTPEVLQALCDMLMLQSQCGVLMGVIHKPPQNFTELERLFSCVLPHLGMVDTVYSPTNPMQIEMYWALNSDDEEVLKLVPGAQLKLFDMSLQET
jgi:hypothetical protein